ncbi:hypothetical protein B0H10DRAFT_2213327 [Mycena sp. CBHHK59/15]|nr:hypothetical protein B0H10DRAFT_2213327 [Mycena sp. CBHHK59/15]
MPAVPHPGTSTVLPVAGHALTSVDLKNLLIIMGTVGGFLLLSFVFLLFTPKLARWGRPKSSNTKTMNSVNVSLARPAAARLRPDITLPESPFAPRPPIRKARTAGPVVNVYRYPGNCWNQEYLIPGTLSPRPPQLARVRPMAPPPLRQVSMRLASEYKVPQQGGKPVNQVQSSMIEEQIQKNVTADLSAAYLRLWEDTKNLYQVADDIVGAHPEALPLADRFSHAAPQIFPRVPSNNEFKFGLVHMIDTTSSRVSPVKQKAPKEDKPLVNWSMETYTLDPSSLRGNKLQRPPFVKSRKVNVTTNVVFPKTSPFYTSTTAEKENYLGSVV